MSQGTRDSIGIVERQFGLLQEQPGACDDLCPGHPIDRGQDPHRFCQHQPGDPSTRFDISICCLCLGSIVAHQKADQDIRINRAHGATGPIA